MVKKNDCFFNHLTFRFEHNAMDVESLLKKLPHYHGSEFKLSYHSTKALTQTQNTKNTEYTKTHTETEQVLGCSSFVMR